MSIPESQLTAWARQGATSTASTTYSAVRTALTATTSRVRARSVEIYLQGSYRNETNVRGDSDVDVVAQLNDIFYPDITRLEQTQRQRYQAQSGSAVTYTWEHFRGDVLAALRSHFGQSAVTQRDKCLSIAQAPGRLAADVVVAAQYRRYTRFSSAADQLHSTGITFWTQRENRQVVNWPKQHQTNGASKNQSTGGHYKPNVRVFKNARSRLVEDGRLGADVAPSYFLECLLYNVPNGCFRSSHSSTFYAVLEWLYDRDMSEFVCQNHLVWLFGQTPEQWALTRAQTTVQALISLWNSW